MREALVWVDLKYPSGEIRKWLELGEAGAPMCGDLHDLGGRWS